MLSAVAGAEGVVAVDAAQRGKRGGEGIDARRLLGREAFVGVFFGLIDERFLGVKTEIFEQDALFVLHARDEPGYVRSDAIGRERDLQVEQFAETHGHGLETMLRLEPFALRPPQVAHQHEPAAAVEHVADRRQGLSDPPVIGDVSVLERDVEVHAHQDAPSGDVDLVNGALGHSDRLRCSSCQDLKHDRARRADRQPGRHRESRAVRDHRFADCRPFARDR
jgi:hypothetical protein